MLSSNAAIAHSPPPPVAMPATDAPIAVESRFGTIIISSAARMTFPQGLLGFSDYHVFGVAPLPNGKHPQFRVLQSLEASDLAFLVAPFNIESGAISAHDIDDACEALGIERQDLMVLLIVTVRREGEAAQVSVNLRAPVFVDAHRGIARQYVLPNTDYAIRHPL